MHKCMRETGTEEHPPMFILIHAENSRKEIIYVRILYENEKNITHKNKFFWLER